MMVLNCGWIDVRLHVPGETVRYTPDVLRDAVVYSCHVLDEALNPCAFEGKKASLARSFDEQACFVGVFDDSLYMTSSDKVFLLVYASHCGFEQGPGKMKSSSDRQTIQVWYQSAVYLSREKATHTITRTFIKKVGRFNQ